MRAMVQGETHLHTSSAEHHCYGKIGFGLLPHIARVFNYYIQIHSIATAHAPRRAEFGPHGDLEERPQNDVVAALASLGTPPPQNVSTFPIHGRSIEIRFAISQSNAGRIPKLQPVCPIPILVFVPGAFISVSAQNRLFPCPPAACLAVSPLTQHDQVPLQLLALRAT